MKEEVKSLMSKEKYNFSDLVEIMKILRSEGGCPWDREQDHKSIRKNFIEEVYEAVEAIDTDDPVLLREELGDVMLQVVFHARISEEAGEFTINDVSNDICAKLILRHPHIFGDVTADTSEKVLENWDAIKMKSKGQESAFEVLSSVSKALPSLMRAQKILHKGKKNHLSSRTLEDAAEALKKLGSASQSEREELLGKVFFSLCGYADSENIDAEKSIFDETEKYIASAK